MALRPSTAYVATTRYYSGTFWLRARADLGWMAQVCYGCSIWWLSARSPRPRLVLGARCPPGEADAHVFGGCKQATGEYATSYKYGHERVRYEPYLLQPRATSKYAIPSPCPLPELTSVEIRASSPCAVNDSRTRTAGYGRGHRLSL